MLNVRGKTPNLALIDQIESKSRNFYQVIYFDTLIFNYYLYNNIFKIK